MPPIGSGPGGLQKCAEEGVCFCSAQIKEEVTSPFSSLSHSSVGKRDPGMVRDGMGECGAVMTAGTFYTARAHSERG